MCVCVLDALKIYYLQFFMNIGNRRKNSPNYDLLSRDITTGVKILE